MDCSLPGSSVHGISQERMQEWVAISFSSEMRWMGALLQKKRRRKEKFYVRAKESNKEVARAL